MENEAPGYRVWAVDNVVYGPVDLPTLISWVKEERINAQTWIFSESLNSWDHASSLPELKSVVSTGSKSPVESGTKSATGLRPGVLRRIKLFASMSDDQLERFITFMEVQHIPPLTEIVKQGSPGDAMYLILEGEVRVRLVIQGKETTLATLPSGEFFGEISLFDHGPRSADVFANKDTLTLKISASAFQRLMKEAPELASPFLYAVGKTLTSRIRADNKRIQESISLTRSFRTG